MNVRKMMIMALFPILPAGLMVQLGASDPPKTPRSEKALIDRAADIIHQGRQTFRFDTFGDEDFWAGALKLNKAIEGAAPAAWGRVSPRGLLSVSG